MNNNDEVKIIDRRRFDDVGNERNEDNKGDSIEGVVSASSKAELNLEKQDTGKDTPLPEIDFSGFIMSFATQAMMQLGLLKPPEGIPLQVDLLAAKQTIDILEMLEKKTRSNLDESEKKLFEEILHSLRLSYLRGLNK